MTNIASVVEVGEEETCDLEVDHPDHQFYLSNGVLTSNSHAVAYAIDSFWCAWLLTHHEEQWLCAYLEAMSTSPDKRAKAFGEARALGYTIVPIDVNHAGVGWVALPGKRLMPSMTSVKGVGDSAVEELMSMRPFENIEQLLWNDDGTWRSSKFTRKAFEALVKIQAFDSLGCVGPGSVFKSYRHMHETLMGSYEEEVPVKKGSDETRVRVRDHAALIKRSTSKDPHQGRKNFYELARGLADVVGDEWSRKELAEFKAEYFGTVDVTTMFDPRFFAKLEELNIPSVEELGVGETNIVWFVTVLAAAKKGATPTAGLIKTTRNKKQFVQAFVTGQVGKPMRMNVWGKSELLPQYTLYRAEVKRDDYGFSTTPWKMREIA
jgi:hypothetical protein